MPNVRFRGVIADMAIQRRSFIFAIRNCCRSRPGPSSGELIGYGRFYVSLPDTDFHVHAWFEGDNEDSDAYETVHCIACLRTHLVNPKTGHVVGDDEAQ